MEVKMFKNEKSRIISIKKTIVLLSVIFMYGQILFAINIPRPEHYKVINGNPIDPVWTIYFEQGSLNIGDEIVVYDGEILVGAGIVISDNIFDNVIPIFSNLYEAGNKPAIKVWVKSENEEYVLNDYTFSNPYGDAWTQEVFPAEDGEYSIVNITKGSIENTEETIFVYPNPVTDILNINSNYKVLNVKVLNYIGQAIDNINVIGIEVTINTSTYNSGIYFIQTETEKGISIQKIIIE
jgi:hypothetical protein